MNIREMLLNIEKKKRWCILFWSIKDRNSSQRRGVLIWLILMENEHIVGIEKLIHSKLMLDAQKAIFALSR